MDQDALPVVGEWVAHAADQLGPLWSASSYGILHSSDAQRVSASISRCYAFGQSVRSSLDRVPQHKLGSRQFCTREHWSAASDQESLYPVILMLLAEIKHWKTGAALTKGFSQQPPSVSTSAPQPAAQDHSKPTIEMSLREHLLAAGAGQSSAPAPIQQQPHTVGPQQHIDPAIAGSQHYMSQADPSDDAEGRKGRRELSTSKRAAQNRAAQRAFRQRKEEYIKQLKDQVKEFEHLCELYKNLQTENYQLRDYIINLQSRLLETQGEVPPAPAGVDLSNRPHAELPSLNPSLQQHQQADQQQQPQHQSPVSGNNGGLSERQIGELQMAAQAAAAAQNGPNAGKHAGQFDAGDYSAEKRTKVEGDVSQGEQPKQTPPYPDADAYKGQKRIECRPKTYTVVGADYNTFVGELQHSSGAAE
ncbi:hypothetical protein OPT61_g8967 [Boeremia exigua]|uniref:Uncharacterized protein n=1 Tax=Boeremia exigua TaxID=749465 RepID=A0ACC2HWP0_9PLEO|nr:hypothetical protein OPT61_g8967 [Boeremia exigua]